MADNPNDTDVAQAGAEFAALSADASHADTLTSAAEGGLELHAVANVGRYAVPPQGGWNQINEVIASNGLGFAPDAYPSFDQIVAKRFGHSVLTDVREADYNAPVYVHLRENLAAVRNFILQRYYSETPEGMTAERAEQAIAEIARYVGEGLHNNPRLKGLLSYHDLSKAFIDLPRAAKPDGEGARYLYERILESDRHGSWIRPFAAIAALFGGNRGGDWQLVPLAYAPFYQSTALPALDQLSTIEEIDAAIQQLDALESKQRFEQEQLEAAMTVNDLEALGNHLLYTAESLRDVQQMSEPVKQDAIEIAREILRKLRLSMGESKLLDGLGLKPRDGLDELGGIKAVALVYERLLGWARGVDASILQHPSIVAATQAVGQIGYVAKAEAIRVAKLAGNLAHAKHLEQQLNFVPGAYADPEKEKEMKLSALLDRVERGIDTVLNRVVTISGPTAAVGHARDKELGSYMAGTPVAGMAMQARAEGSANRDATGKQQSAIQEGMAAAQRAQVQRVTQQVANQQSRRGNTMGTQNATAASTRGSLQSQLASMRQRLAQMRRNVVAQQQNMMNVRTNAARMQSLHAHDDHAHDHHQPPDPIAATMAKMDPRLIQNIKQMNTMTAGLTTNPVLTGRAAFDKMKQATTYGLKNPEPGSKPMTEEERQKQQQLLDPPPPPKKDKSRGF